MKTNNPRKNREAEKARVETVAFESPTVKVGEGGAAKVSQVEIAGADSGVAKVGSKVAETGNSQFEVAKAGSSGLSEVGGSELLEADSSEPQNISASVAESSESPEPIKPLATSASFAPLEQSELSGLSDSETVAFNSATEMLVKTQQQMKMAKVAAARQKRAKEMDAAQKKARARKIRKRILLGIFGIILVAVLVVVLAFCANRWWLYNDKADIQGTWQVNGTDATITFTEDSIVLTDEVAYKYELNPENKTIKFNFGTLSGVGSYRFSLDRDQLSVTDGETEATGDLMEDIGWWINAMLAQMRGEQLAPTIDASSVGFERE